MSLPTSLITKKDRSRDIIRRGPPVSGPPVPGFFCPAKNERYRRFYLFVLPYWVISWIEKRRGVRRFGIMSGSDETEEKRSVVVQYRKVRQRITLSSLEEQFRNRIAQELSVDAERMKIVYKGKILKSNQDISAHAMKGHVLYIVGSARETYVDSQITLTHRFRKSIWKYVRHILFECTDEFLKRLVLAHPNYHTFSLFRTVQIPGRTSAVKSPVGVFLRHFLFHSYHVPRRRGVFAQRRRCR